MSQSNGRPAWLLLVHQLPPRPSNVRVKTWRRLQGLGAIALRNAVYVLPNTNPCREDFEWIKSEIEGMRGEATVFAADSIDSFSNDEVVTQVQRAFDDNAKQWREWSTNISKLSRPRASLDIAEFLLSI